jgi:tripartite-type tricarboxylate transporter receptor subunit TctC
MKIRMLLAAALGLQLAAGGAQAQGQYPTKPIRLVVPFPAGGQTDIVARSLTQKIGESFGQTVVIDNRPGAGGTIGAEIGVRAPADGYTLIMISTSYTSNAALYKLAYHPMNDIVPVTYIGEIANLVTVHPSGPAKSVNELVAYAKANPGRINYGSGGTGSGNHLAAELFSQMTGARFTHVPYKGATSAVNDLIGGNIQLIFGGLPGLIPHHKAGRVRGLAVTSIKRSRSVPDIPTVAETVPGYEAVSWASIIGPRGVPRDIVARWNREMDRVLKLPDIRERMAVIGLEPVGGPPERLRELLVRDLAKWQKVVQTANIKLGG